MLLEGIAKYVTFYDPCRNWNLWGNQCGLLTMLKEITVVFFVTWCHVSWKKQVQGWLIFSCLSEFKGQNFSMIFMCEISKISSWKKLNKGESRTMAFVSVCKDIEKCIKNVMTKVIKKTARSKVCALNWLRAKN